MRLVPFHLAAAAVLAASATLVLAQSSTRALPQSTRLEPRDFVPLGTSASGSGTASWYLDLARERVVVCVKGERLACETAPMPK